LVKRFWRSGNARDSAGEAIMVRTAGDVIAMSPPLIISRPQVDQLVDRLSGVLLNLK
jgi:beta-alanine--pyruvate transaminase